MNRPASHRTPAVPARSLGAYARTLGFALIALALGASAAHSAVDRWTPYGPGEGSLRSLVASSRGDLYTTTNFAAGEIWQRPINNPIWRWRGQSLGRPGISPAIALAVHPKNPSSLWAVVPEPDGSNFESVFRSTDGGATWQKRFTGGIDFLIARLTVAPTRNSVALFAETGDSPPRRLWRSADLGTSWSEVAGATGPVAAPPDLPDTVYATKSSGDGLLKSTDGGRTFGPAGALPIAEGDRILALHATYGRPAIVLVSLAHGGLFRSIDAGASWRRVGFVDAGPAALASEPLTPKTIYAAVSPPRPYGPYGAGIYASTLGGQNGSFRNIASFNLSPLQIVATTALAAAPGGPYFVAGNELYRVRSQTFERVSVKGVEAFGVAEVRFHPRDPSLVAVRRYTGCIREACDVRTLLSTDGGATFTRLGGPIGPRLFSDVFDLAFDPDEPNRRLTANGIGVFFSGPNGTGGTSGPPASAVEIAAEGILLAGGFLGIEISEDEGVTWTNALDPTFSADDHHLFPGTREVVDLVTNPYAPERVIARSLEVISGLPHDPGRTVLYKSTDSGRTWTWLRDGDADVEFVSEAPASFYLLFATESGTELRRSDDFGATSTLVHTFASSEAVSDVATDPHAPGDLYAATRLGVRRSRDGGATWEATAGGFNPFGPYRRWVEKVQVAPDAAGRLIASPLDGGLFENRLSD